MMGILGNAEIISISADDTDIKEMASAIFKYGQINNSNVVLLKYKMHQTFFRYQQNIKRGYVA